MIAIFRIACSRERTELESTETTPYLSRHCTNALLPEQGAYVWLPAYIFYEPALSATVLIKPFVPPAVWWWGSPPLPPSELHLPENETPLRRPDSIKFANRPWIWPCIKRRNDFLCAPSTDVGRRSRAPAPRVPSSARMSVPIAHDIAPGSRSVCICMRAVPTLCYTPSGPRTPCTPLRKSV